MNFFFINPKLSLTSMFLSGLIWPVCQTDLWLIVIVNYDLCLSQGFDGFSMFSLCLFSRLKSVCM